MSPHAAPCRACTHAARVRSRCLRRTLIIGLTAFLTVVDLFATQAILPSLARAYQVTPAAMGLAVNASTLGMAVAGLAVALFEPPHRPAARHPGQPRAARRSRPRCSRSRRTSTTFTIAAHRAGALHGLGLHADAGLSRRGMQRDGRRRRVRRLHHRQCREQSDRPPDVGRRRRSSRACGQLLFLLPCSTSPARCWSISPSTATDADGAGRGAGAAARDWLRHLRNAPLRAAFGIGFCILFAFIGTFTYVNFVLVARAAVARADGLGLRLFRLPAVGRHHAVRRARGADASARGPPFWGALALAGLGLPLLLTGNLPAVLAGLMLVGVGTFFAQAVATGFVGRAATERPRRGERHLSRVLFLRRTRRQRGARPAVRPLRLGRLRRRHRALARRCRRARGETARLIAPRHRNQSQPIFHRGSADFAFSLGEANQRSPPCLPAFCAHPQPSSSPSP